MWTGYEQSLITDETENFDESSLFPENITPYLKVLPQKKNF